jgi:phosphate acetyltransferase
MLKDSEIGNIAAMAPAGDPPGSKYERLIADAKQVPAATTVVTALRGPIEAAYAGIIVPILVGPAAKIAAVAREHRLDISRFGIVEVPHSHAAAKGVELIRASKGELLMKGSVSAQKVAIDNRTCLSKLDWPVDALTSFSTELDNAETSARRLS